MLRLGFRPIVPFALELQHIVIAPHPPNFEKLQSKGIALHTCSVYIYYARTRNQRTWAEPFIDRAKVEFRHQKQAAASFPMPTIMR